ncbi:MAG: PqqD family protein [Chloroflexi bacterium]|nr:PqqD family protein [Chloroflexota bacterium]
MTNPRRITSARSKSVLGGLAVFDARNRKFHLLNRTAALVWNRCDGETSPEDLIGLVRDEMHLRQEDAEKLLWLAIEELESSRLLVEPVRSTTRLPLNRRQLLQALAAVGLAAALLPTAILWDPREALAAPNPAETQTTSAPTTSAPTTSAPTTSAPTTSAPTTSAPTTSAPTTSAPSTTTTTSAPTAVALLSFIATGQGSQISLIWETAGEQELSGFNVYRGDSPLAYNLGLAVKLNGQLIAGKAASPLLGASYSFVDVHTASGSTCYWLEAVNYGGGKQVEGPVSPAWWVYFPNVKR